MQAESLQLCEASGRIVEPVTLPGLAPEQCDRCGAWLATVQEQEVTHHPAGHTGIQILSVKLPVHLAGESNAEDPSKTAGPLRNDAGEVIGSWWITPSGNRWACDRSHPVWDVRFVRDEDQQVALGRDVNSVGLWTLDSHLPVSTEFTDQCARWVVELLERLGGWVPTPRLIEPDGRGMGRENVETGLERAWALGWLQRRREDDLSYHWRAAPSEVRDGA